MKAPHSIWKLGSLAFGAMVIIGVTAPGITTTPVNWFYSAMLLAAALGTHQYAFGWPSLPILWWRLFGPAFSLLWLHSSGFAVGFVGTWLAIRDLDAVRIAAGLIVIGAYLLATAAALVPLFRLGHWAAVGRKAASVASPAPGLQEPMEHA